MVKFTLVKKTRDLENVWSLNASFLHRKPRRAPKEAPLEALEMLLAARVGRQRKRNV